MQPNQSKKYFQQPLDPDELAKDNMIRMTRRIIRGMNKDERLEKARAHVKDALKYKNPRPQSQSLQTPALFTCLYAVHSSSVWEWILFILSYLYMYMVVLDYDQYGLKIGLQTPILVVFWVEMGILFYTKTFDNMQKKRNIYSGLFKFQVVLIALMTIDLIVFIAAPGEPGSRPIRPFRILRCFVPIIFDAEMRKTMLSLVKAYKDILVYFVFFTFVVVGYAVIGTASLHYDPQFQDPNFPQRPDPYKTNFSSLSTMIFMVYVTATYDSYPDNQILAVQNYEPNYAYYIIFIFLNMFLFSSIPGSLIYNEYRSARSKILLVDQIRQQHSLLLAFVTLAQDQRNLRISTLIEFLLYLYRNKIRFVQHITDICLKIDQNNDQTIQVMEFMQLSKILLQNHAMLPPTFDDIECWISLRECVNSRLNLKNVLKSIWFQLGLAIVITLSIINAIFLLFNPSSLNEVFDGVFVWVFGVELLIRFIAVGPQNYFMDRYNRLDALIVFLGLILFFPSIGEHDEAILRLLRIFRVASFVKRVGEECEMSLTVWQKLTKIFVILLQILPIIFKFFPLFLFFFYIFGIAGMELFYDFYQTDGSPAYNLYQQFSSFRSFMQSQYIMVQILTEAGWSMVAYDHCWRSPHYYAYIMIYFCLMHLTITYIIATLIKGIFWEVFFTVADIFDQKDRKQKYQIRKENANNLIAAQMKEIQQKIENNDYINPDTVLKRQLIDNKIDEQIFKKLRNYHLKKSQPAARGRNKKKTLMKNFMHEWNIERSSAYDRFNLSSMAPKRKKSGGTSMKSKQKMKLEDIEEVEEEDFQSQMSSLLDNLIIDPKIKYSELVASPKVFIDYLKHKLKPAKDFGADTGFSEHLHPLYNPQSMDFHIFEVREILGIETSKREQKQMIINRLENEGTIQADVADRLLKKRLNEKVFQIDTLGTLRSLFLSGTDEQLISKFQTQYFSDLYGYSFKQINKMTLQPLLKHESALTYSLRNILRYPQIDNTIFFQMFTHIQDQISNKLLQKGSLFKFLYKLEHQGDVWFSIEYKHQQSMRVHFIKTGIWVYHKDMQPNTTYYARDIFNWDFEDRKDASNCLQYMTRFYQSFEGLAYSLNDHTKFFQNSPTQYIYDLFVQTIDVRSNPRFVNQEFQISKIMVVVLSKQQLRKDINQPLLPYKLTNISLPEQQGHTELQFKLDQSQTETFDKLKNLAAMDAQRIVQSQGLPFAYIVNLMDEMRDIVSIYGNNFIFQIERVLNDQFTRMDEEQQSENEMSKSVRSQM